MSYRIRIGQAYHPQPGDEYYDGEKPDPFIRDLMIYGYRPVLNTQLPGKAANDTGLLSGWAAGQIEQTLGLDMYPVLVEYSTEEGKRVFEILKNFSNTQYGKHWPELAHWLEWFAKLAIDKYGNTAAFWLG